MNNQHSEKEIKLRLDRFFVNVPQECVEDFMADMKEEVRTAPDLTAAILVKYYRRRKRLVLQTTAQELGESDKQNIPVYGPRQSRTSNEAEEATKGGA